MKRKAIFSLLLAAVLFFPLVGCGEEAVETTEPPPSSTSSETTLTQPSVFTLPRTEESLHPILSNDQVNLALSGLIWEGLFELDNTFTPQPLLCTGSSVGEDGLIWTFTLRKGVTFSDGSPLTSYEVADSLNLARSAQSRYAGRLSGIRSVTAGEGSVTVELTVPNGALPALLDIPIIKGEGEFPLGTGPYMPEWSGDELRLTARSDWWGGQSLPFPSISLRTIRAADDLIYAFDTGDISLVTEDLTGSNALGFAGNSEVWDCPSTTMVYVGYNCARGACVNPVLRQALDRSLDRRTVAVALFSRHAQASALPVPLESPLYNESSAQARSYSPQTASELLEKEGYSPDGDGLWTKNRKVLSLTLLVNTDNTFRLSAGEYLAKSLQEAGISVELKKLPWADYQKALSNGEFDLYLATTVLSPDFDPTALIMAGGTLNFGNYQSTVLSERLSAYRSAAGNARSTAATELWAGLETEVPFSTLCFKNQSVLTHWGMVSGLAPTQFNLFYQMENWKVGG